VKDRHAIAKEVTRKPHSPSPYRSELISWLEETDMDRWSRKRITSGLCMLVITVALLVTFPALAALAQESSAPEIPQVSVQFAHEPYFDHTNAIIGIEQGWFDEVGITLEPDGVGIVVGGDEALATFASGRLDVMSGSAQLLMPAAKNLPPFKVFFYSDIFQGYAILAQPDGNYTSFAEFIAQGMDPDEAFQATMGQMTGKIFAYPPEAAIKGFIDLALSKGGVTLEDMESNVAEDSANVALMQAGRADFQVGGVPSRLSLESTGFKPILTSADLAQYAQPSADSVELRAVFHDGWLATDEWIAENHDTMLRLAGVGFRINEFIKTNPEEAMAIHTPFLNSVAGTDFDDTIATVVYESLDPFVPFADQAGWHQDPEEPLNAEYVIGSAIKLYEEQGVFQPDEFAWDDFTIANQVYQELVDYRDQAEAIIAELEGQELSGEAADWLAQAQHHFEIFNYLDAFRFAEAAQAAAA
jgi:ABC-type nitrate/sulfonate/bicarbonate transport system substrate-binding protein